jgi:hypothetical protein
VNGKKLLSFFGASLEGWMKFCSVFKIHPDVFGSGISKSVYVKVLQLRN